MSATEVPPNFITRRAIGATRPRRTRSADAIRLERRAKRRVYIPAGSGGRNRDARLTKRALAMAGNPQRHEADRRRRPRSRGFRALAAEWWDPRGKMARAAQVQSGAARLSSATQACRALRPRSQAARLPDGPAHPRHRLRRRHPVRAAGAARRRHGRRRSGGGQHRGGAAARRAKRARRSTTAAPPRRRWPSRRALRRRAGHGGGRARRRRAAVRQALRRDGEARRADDRRPRSTARSRASRWRSSAPNTCCAGCRVGTHRWDKFVTPNELEIAMEQQRAARASTSRA